MTKTSLLTRALACVLGLIAASTAAARTQGAPAEPQGKSQTGDQAPGEPPKAPRRQVGAAIANLPASAPGLVRIGEAGNVVRLGATSAKVLLTVPLEGSGLDKLSGTELARVAATLMVGETSKIGSPTGSVVALSAPSFVGRPAGNSLAWVVTVEAADLPPNTTERRLASVWLGCKGKRQLYSLEFTLTNQPPASAIYDVVAPAHDWFVSRSAPDARRTYPLMITNRTEEVSALRLSHVSLKRSDDGSSIAFDEVKLLSDPTKPAATIDLLPNETRTVFLRLDDPDRPLPFGSFSGQVQLVSTGTSPRIVPITLRVTSDGVRLVGGLLVLIGLLTSLFVTGTVQPRLARLLALRPATVLRDRIVAFSAHSMSLARGDVSGIIAEADRQADRLAPRELDRAGLLPSSTSIAGGASTGTTKELQALLTDVAARFEGLTVLRHTVVALVARQPLAGRRAEVQKAIDDLNGFAPLASTAHVALEAATGILAQMRAAAPAQTEDLGVVPAQVTTEQLDFMLHQTASIAALIWAAVSLAIGVTYIYADVDFGTPVDLLSMFLWGLGLTTFGAGIQQLTPRQVATQIGISVPQSGAGDAPRG